MGLRGLARVRGGAERGGRGGEWVLEGWRVGVGGDGEGVGGGGEVMGVEGVGQVGEGMGGGGEGCVGGEGLGQEVREGVRRVGGWVGGRCGSEC